jgi:hypothetical protein
MATAFTVAAELLAWFTAALVTGIVLWSLRDGVAVLMTAVDDHARKQAPEISVRGCRRRR